MKPKKLLFLILIFSPISLFSQEPDSIDLWAWWEAGDTLDYEVTKITTQDFSTGTKKLDTVNYSLKFIVLEEKETEYHIKWIITNYINTGEENPEGKELLRRLMGVKGWSIEYITDEFGMFLDLKNWDEIEKSLRVAMEQGVTTKDLNPSEKKRLDTFIEPFLTKDGFLQIQYPEIAVFHQNCGYSLPVNEPVEYSLTAQNMFDSTIDWEGEIMIDSVNTEHYYCAGYDFAEPNVEQIKEMVDLIMKELLPTKKAGKELTRSSKYKSNTKTYFEYYYDKYIPITIKEIQSIDIDLGYIKNYRVNQIHFQLVNFKRE